MNCNKWMEYSIDPDLMLGLVYMCEYVKKKGWFGETIKIFSNNHRSGAEGIHQQQRKLKEKNELLD